MRLRVRLQRLERDKGIDRSCPTCRPRRGLAAMVDVTPQSDETVAYANDAHKPCERCGVVPESVTETVEVVVESPAAV